MGDTFAKKLSKRFELTNTPGWHAAREADADGRRDDDHVRRRIRTLRSRRQRVQRRAGDPRPRRRVHGLGHVRGGDPRCRDEPADQCVRDEAVSECDEHRREFRRAQRGRDGVSTRAPMHSSRNSTETRPHVGLCGADACRPARGRRASESCRSRPPRSASHGASRRSATAGRPSRSSSRPPTGWQPADRHCGCATSKSAASRVRALRGQPGVTIDVRLNADAHALAVADTRFWIVRPRIGRWPLRPRYGAVRYVYRGRARPFARTTHDVYRNRHAADHGRRRPPLRCARHRSARSRSARPSITGAHAWAR